MSDEQTMEIGFATAKEAESNSHTPSRIQADTLFTFTSELEFLIPYIKNSCLYPRYCDEDIEYLGIEKIKRIYIPMKCFCDINLHRIQCHLDWYGYYGLAFPKEWGMKNGIQPIQYINPDSKLRKDFSFAFNQILNDDSSVSSNLSDTMKNFILHEFMYYKPYEGKMKNRMSNKIEKKCFTDECEWRYIPDLSDTDFQQIYYDPNIMHAGIMSDISNSLTKVSGISLNFNYSDIKYIIIKTTDDFIKLVSVIDELNIDSNVRNELISKIIIWDKSKEDF